MTKQQTLMGLGVWTVMITGALMLLPGSIFGQGYVPPPATVPSQPSIYDRAPQQTPAYGQPPAAYGQPPAAYGQPPTAWPVQQAHFQDTGEQGLPAQPPAASAPVPAVAAPTPMIGAAQPGEHPLVPALRWAKQVQASLVNVKDYTCTLVKRERVDGQLGDYQFLFVKVRHEPFSVYTYFVGPPDLKGQEALYIAGQNDGKMWAHSTGLKNRLIGTVSLHPTSTLAMSGNRYPITEMGIRRLTDRLIEVGENDMQYGECTVQVMPGVKVDDRVCTRVEIVHPVPRREFLYHVARVYVDDELQLPIRFESYGWPSEQGGPPPLLEEYTYRKLKINPGLNDADFDTRNAQYSFK